MKAIRFYGKEDVRVEDVVAPTAMGDAQVMVKPLTCGICGTDLHEFAGGPIVNSEHAAQVHRGGAAPNSRA